MGSKTPQTNGIEPIKKPPESSILSEMEEEGPSDWGERYEEWRDALGDDQDLIKIYVYRPERSGTKIRNVQEYVWELTREDEYPDTHEIGLVCGGGQFTVIARARGKEILQKKIFLGAAYNRLRDENAAALESERLEAEPLTRPQGGGQYPTPGPSLLDQLTAFASSPLAASLAKMFNPMEQVRAIQEMGSEMARQSFKFKLEAARDAANFLDERDTEEDPQQGGNMNGVATRPNWEEKLSGLADLILAKGESFIKAGPLEKNFTKRAILNDRDFQSLIRDPVQLKQTLSGLYKKVEPKLVHAVMKELGIQTPVALPHQQAKGKPK